MTGIPLRKLKQVHGEGKGVSQSKKGRAKKKKTESRQETRARGRIRKNGKSVLGRKESEADNGTLRGKRAYRSQNRGPGAKNAGENILPQGDQKETWREIFLKTDLRRIRKEGGKMKPRYSKKLTSRSTLP